MTAVNSKLPEGLFMFEQPFLRAPNESLKRQFRAAQKHVERDMGNLKTMAKEMSQKEGQTTEDAIDALDSMIAKVDALQSKLAEVHEKGTTPIVATMRARLRHLDELDKLEEDELDPWTDTRLNRWLVDWNLRSGHMETARLLADENGIEDLVDSSLFAEIQRIEQALEKHSCTEALAWCSDNKNALRKIKSTLEFELRLQEYIELARAEKQFEALLYCRKHLQPWQETHFDRIRQATGLIAMGPKRKVRPYQKNFYSEKRWSFLVEAFRKAIYELHSLPSEPLLHYALSAGLTALKVPACYDATCHNIDCPVCDSQGLGVLAKEVPFSHHANSTIVCRITGKIMNEDNPPLAFSNGNVYSSEAMQEMAKNHNGIVTCPRSGQQQPIETLRKVFVS